MPAQGSPGSIYQRGDGKWVAALSLGGGRRVVRYGKTRREAQTALQTLLREHHAGQLVPPSRLTLAEWAAQWLEASASLRPTTLATYHRALAPALADVGHMRLEQLTPLALNGMFVRLARAGHGTRAVQQAYTYLHACLARAVAFGLLGANPLSRVPRPRHVAREGRQWTADEARRFVATARQARARYAPLFLFLLGAGCREGEALALRWRDVDLAHGSVYIRHGLTHVDGEVYVGPPKSAAGVRRIALPRFALDELRALPRPLEDAALFRTAAGTVPSRRNLLRAFVALCRQADVPTIPVHSLRRVCAALVAASGTDPHSLRRRLGHARVSMTWHYAYPIGLDVAAAEALQRALQPQDDQAGW